MLLQTFSKIWVVVSFKINQTQIAKTLCVKKEIENNTCQGKCHLKKQLDKTDEKEQKQVPNNQKEKSEVLYSHSLAALEIVNQPVFVSKNIISNYKSGFYSSSYITDIFHPPKLNFI
ncbi:MAG: hypothetical protein Q7T20_07760 [Saprospiraceae bacterium]|nr:hypothetical protein [Saprospiraceae bacterium]